MRTHTSSAMFVSSQVQASAAPHQLGVSSAHEDAETISIERATDVPVAWLESFYDRMFPARAPFLKRHWRWLYRVKGDRQTLSPIVATNGTEVVGHLGIISVTLCRNDEEYPAIWLVDAAVLPEYRRQDIATRLGHAVMTVCPLQLGFGNERSMPLLAKLGWTLRDDTVALRLLLRPESHALYRFGWRKAMAATAGSITRIVSQGRTFPLQELTVRPVEDPIDFSHGGLGSALHVRRSADFLRWRITEHPDSDEYVLLEHRPRRGPRCQALARVVDTASRRLHLLSLGGQPVRRETLSPFLASVVRWALERDIHQILYITSDPRVASMARWWLPSVKRLAFASNANDCQGRAFLDRDEHLWECLDSDFDLTYVSSESADPIRQG